MSPDLEARLFSRFPSFFRPERSPMESLICFGIETGDGWFKLLWSLCEDLERITSSLTEFSGEYQFEVTQVKEKYGTLRFYCNGASEIAYNRIYEAERLSGFTCEECGGPGVTVVKGGWYKTLCKPHEVEYGYDGIPKEVS